MDGQACQLGDGVSEWKFYGHEVVRTASQVCFKCQAEPSLYFIFVRLPAVRSAHLRKRDENLSAEYKPIGNHCKWFAGRESKHVISNKNV